MTPTHRALAAAGGLCGAAGVGLSAYTSHAEGGTIAIAANFLLMHAPVFLVLALTAAPKFFVRAAVVLLSGLVIFSLDLILRDLMGVRLFPSAAPLGGLLMIFGWLGLVAAAAFSRSGEP